MQKKAEFVRDYLVQGTKVMMEGEIITGSYDNKEIGKKVYTTELFADRIEFAGAKVQEKMPEPMDGFLNIPESMEEEMQFR